VVVEEASVPKRQSETPPPTYEEALYRYTAYSRDSFSFSKGFLSKIQKDFLPFFLFLTVALYSLSLFLSSVYSLTLEMTIALDDFDL
jgi:hypothetical protein